VTPLASALLGGVSSGSETLWLVGVPAAMMGATFLLVVASWAPVRAAIGRQEAYYERVLRGNLLMDVRPRTVTLLALAAVGLMALIFYVIVQHWLMGAAGGACGLFLPTAVIAMLKKIRLQKLEDQLVDGVQTLSSGVRAGLNLIQAMDLLEEYRGKAEQLARRPRSRPASATTSRPATRPTTAPASRPTSRPAGGRLSAGEFRRRIDRVKKRRRSRHELFEQLKAELDRIPTRVQRKLSSQ